MLAIVVTFEVSQEPTASQIGDKHVMHVISTILNLEMFDWLRPPCLVEASGVPEHL